MGNDGERGWRCAEPVRGAVRGDARARLPVRRTRKRRRKRVREPSATLLRLLLRRAAGRAEDAHESSVVAPLRRTARGQAATRVSWARCKVGTRPHLSELLSIRRKERAFLICQATPAAPAAPPPRRAAPRIAERQPTLPRPPAATAAACAQPRGATTRRERRDIPSSLRQKVSVRALWTRRQLTAQATSAASSPRRPRPREPGVGGAGTPPDRRLPLVGGAQPHLAPGDACCCFWGRASARSPAFDLTPRGAMADSYARIALSRSACKATKAGDRRSWPHGMGRRGLVARGWAWSMVVLCLPACLPACMVVLCLHACMHANLHGGSVPACIPGCLPACLHGGSVPACLPAWWFCACMPACLPVWWFYACIHACLYGGSVPACMPACMVVLCLHPCLPACMHAWWFCACIHACLHGGSVPAPMPACMVVLCLHPCMHACMHACTCVCIKNV
eukprot:83259-Chlamydomonas_euryale.AAC.5